MSKEIKIIVANPNIPESLFRDYYLPGLMTGDLRAEWIENVSKNPFNRVDVVSDNDNLEILFTVPQMFYPPVDLTDTDVARRIQEARLIGKQFTARHKDMSLERNVGSMIKPSPIPEEDKSAWGSILTKYDIAVGKGSLATETDAASLPEDVAEDW